MPLYTKEPSKGVDNEPSTVTLFHVVEYKTQMDDFTSTKLLCTKALTRSVENCLGTKGKQRASLQSASGYIRDRGAWTAAVHLNSPSSTSNY